jgi:hypothetical protein
MRIEPIRGKKQKAEFEILKKSLFPKGTERRALLGPNFRHTQNGIKQPRNKATKFG